ncbi:nuclear transport factor 2 family protein [Streptomyces sp. NPDC051658]|uniref:nuclear transport factor 2 family protein n=1 Tax=Streptomyces sp. NPDC051658 TaxID=3365667 RepID=UPI00378CD4A4
MEQNIGDKAIDFLRFLEIYDFSSAQAMCTDTAAVWQNDGKGAQAIGESLEHFKSFAANVRSLRYDIIRQFQNSNEVLQQQVLRLDMADGSHREAHATVYFRFEGGLIDRIEEAVYTVPTDKAS